MKFIKNIPFTMWIVLAFTALAFAAAGVGITTWGTYTTLADGDLFATTDVSDTSGSDDGTSKTVSYLNLKANLKTYLDTIYQAWDADLDIYAGITPSANTQTFLGAATFQAMLDLLESSNYTPTGAVDLTGASSLTIGTFLVTDTYMALKTQTSATDYFEIGAYDVDGTAYKGLIRFVAGNDVYGFLGDNETNAWRWDEDGNLVPQGTASIDLPADTVDLADMTDDSVSYLETTGSSKALTPVTGTAAGFAAGFTGANLYGGTYVVNTTGTAQLPAMLVNMNFSIITLGAIAVIIDTNVADGYLLDGVTGAEGANITNLSTAGDIAVIQYYTADDWLMTTNGWTAE